MALLSRGWWARGRGGYATLAVIAAAAIAFFVCQWLPPPPASASNPEAPLSVTPELVFSVGEIPDSIALGESVDLEFQIGLRSGTGGHGGISVSFPDLTARGGNSSSYDSVQGTVTTISYTNGSSHVAYFDEGDQIFKGNDANRRSAEYLLVESDDDDWPSRSGSDYVWRTLKLRVTPKEPGAFLIYSRFWLCGSGYEDCDRRPRPEHSDQEDQQRWSVYEDTVEVSGPTSGPFSRNSAEDFDGLYEAENDDPEGIWSDGTTMWVADSSDSKIYAYNISNKARVSSKDFDTLDSAGNDSPEGIWSDGTTMWVADSSDDKIYAYNMSNKARVSSKDFDTLDSAGNDHPRGIWSDGATMWVADYSADKIYAYNMSNKARVSSKDFDTLDSAGNDHPRGIWSDGATMWVADYSADKIYAYNMSNKARVSSKDFDTLEGAKNDHPRGIWSDRTTMWVADYSDEKIYAYRAPEMAPAPTQNQNRSPSVSRVSPSSALVSLYTGDRQTFTARATDPDNNLKSYSWFVKDRSEESSPFWFGVLPTGSATDDFSHTFGTAGPYTVKATFTDKGGLSDSVSWTVVVRDPNRAPSVVRGSPSTESVSLETGDRQAFTANASDPDNNLRGYEWFVGDVFGDAFVWQTPPTGFASGSFSHTFSTEGTFIVEASFTDTEGLSGSVTWTVTVTTSNRSPSVFRVSPSSALVSLTTGGSQTFQVSATDADNNLTKWEWEVDKHFSPFDGHQEPEETFTATGSITKSFSHTFPDDGTYTVTVTFTDSGGESGTAEWRAEVEDPPNRAPWVSRVSPFATVSVATGDVTFTARAIDPDNNLKSYEWFVDDTSEDDGSWLLVLPTGAVTRTFTHNFSTAGEYTVKVTFTDDEGLSASFPWRVTAVEPITVQLGADNYTVNEDDGEAEVTVTISASPPEYVWVLFRTWDGTAESFWDFSSRIKIVSFPRDTTTLTQTVPVTILDNGAVEATEAFTVALETTSSGLPTYVSLTRSEATVKILDDDEATVAFTENRLSVSDNFALIQIGVEIDTDPSSFACAAALPLDVHFSYTDPDGALSSGSTIPSSVAFGECQSRVDFDIGEGDLTGIGTVTGTTEVVFTLDRVTSAVSGAASRVKIGEPSTMTVTIQDEDEAEVRWRQAYALARERSQYDRLCVVVARPFSTAIGRPFTVHFSYTDPAGALSSESTIPSSVTFGTGELEKCATIELGDVASPSAYAEDLQDEFGLPDQAQRREKNLVLFTLDRVTSVGSDVASRVTIDEYFQVMELEVFAYIGMSANRPPLVSRVSPSSSSVSLETGASQTFTASATDADSNITSYEWTVNSRGVGNSGSLALTGEVSKTFTHTFSSSDPHTVAVVFTDDEGASGSASWTVEVEEPQPPTSNSAPSVSIASPVSPVRLETGEERTFTARGTDADNNLTKWEWEVDKHFSPFHGHQEPEASFASTGRTLKSFRHTFPDDGTYTVTVTFTDSSGESDSEEWRVEVEDPPSVDDKSVTHTCGTEPATPVAGDKFTIVSGVTAGEDLDDVFVRFDFNDPVRGMYDRARGREDPERDPEGSAYDISEGDTVRFTAPGMVSQEGDGWVLRCTVMREAGFFEGYINNNPRQLAVKEKAVTVSPYTQNSGEEDIGYFKSCGRIANEEGGKLGAEFIRKNPGMEVKVNASLFQDGERVWDGSAHKDAGSIETLFTLTFAGQPELQGKYGLDCEMTVKPFHDEVSIKYLLAVPTCISNPFVFSLCAVFLAYDLSTEWALIDSASSTFCVGGYPDCPFTYDTGSNTSPPSVRVGEPVSLSFRTSGLNGVADHGGVTVSFPDLTDVGTTSADHEYVSDKASVSTVSYTTGTSNVTYHRTGASVQTVGGAPGTANYLLVESDDSEWPSGADRALELELTPWEPGTFQVQYRYWLCLAGYDECRRKPKSDAPDQPDQQGWQVDVLEITVNAVPDRDELVEFYEDTDGPNWDDDTDWLSHAPLDDWHGVDTDTGADGRVTVLELPSNSLSGAIPTVVGDLTGLEVLDLSGNGLTGEIPAALESLTALGTLDLSRNELRGEIPADLGDLTALATLDLSSNDLDGAIPSALGSLRNLAVLRLYDNGLNRPIPAELGNLTELTELDLWGNSLSGAIPAELGNLADLQVLNLSDNSLSGAIPEGLGNLADLQVLNLSDNSLSGAIPEGLGRLAKLEAVYLDGNNLDRGCIPATWRNLHNHDLDDVGLPFCDVALSALTVSPGELMPGFDPGVSEYTAQVANSLSETTVTPEVNDSGASYVVKLGGVTHYARVPLAVGGNVITVEVTAEDDSTTQTYTVTVTRAEPPTPELSDDAMLNALTLSGVDFGTFDTTTTSYTAQVANSLSETTVTLEVNDSGASYVIKLGGVTDPDGVITLSVGSNIITVEVTAEDDATTRTYTVTVTRAEPPSTDATLKGLMLSGIDFGTFDSTTTSYTAQVANSVTQTTGAPAVNDSGASYVIKLGGVTDPDGVITLSVGSNIITVEVTAEDDATTRTYAVTVTRSEPPSTDATLKGLMLSGVDFGAFDTTTTSYTAQVANSLSETTVTPEVNDSGASYVIKLGGVTDPDGVITLSVGSNIITVEVTAEDDSTTRTYTVTVTRSEPPSTDATLKGLMLSGVDFGTFDTTTTSYTAQVANSLSETTVTPEVNDSGASYVIKLGGVTDADGVVVLRVGSNVITVEVTAEDDSTTRSYTVTVTRAEPPTPELSDDAMLNALTLSGIDFGTFDSTTSSYTAQVANSVTQTTVTPTVNHSGASYVIKLGGVTDADGVISLAVGSNVITVEVTAEDDSTTQTYTVTVTRSEPPSTDAALSALTLTGIDFGTFASGTTSYTALVANGVTETTVTLTVNHSGASYGIKLGGVTDADGVVVLSVGSNVITVEVTAEDDSTTRTYTVTVTRAEPTSTDATLSAVALSGVDFGTFDSTTTSYTAQVANSVSQTTVTPTVNDSGASYVIKLGGRVDADGVIPLSVGGNVITIEVTSENGDVSRVYTVEVTRSEPAALGTTGQRLEDRYDANNNGKIEKNEVIEAIKDYLFGEGDEAISKGDVIRLIKLYLFG